MGMLARLERIQNDFFMKVGGRRDDDRLDVVIRENCFVVGSLDGAWSSGCSPTQRRGIRIANRRDICHGHAPKRIENFPAPRTKTDHGYLNLFGRLEFTA